VKRSVLVWSTLVILLAARPLAAQDSLTVADTLPGWAINLGVHHTGLSLGNSSRWNGLRINFSDRAVREVNGINVTLWKPGRNRFGVYRGISVGLAPYGASFTGITLGIAGAVAERSMTGLNVGGLGLVANGDLRGVNASILGTVADGSMDGINVAGLGTVAEGDMEGISVAGLATVAQGHMYGVNVSGLATVAWGDMRGIGVSGLAAVSQGDMGPLTIAGLAAVAEGDVQGLTVAGLAVVGVGRVTGATVALGAVESATLIRGVAVAGYRVKAPRVQGFAIPVGWLRAGRLDGVSISAYNRVVGSQHGLTIGLVNYAKALHGMQLGIVNIAGNNHGLARVLPLINVHLR